MSSPGSATGGGPDRGGHSRWNVQAVAILPRGGHHLGTGPETNQLGRERGGAGDQGCERIKDNLANLGISTRWWRFGGEDTNGSGRHGCYERADGRRRAQTIDNDLGATPITNVRLRTPR